eukprot:831877-Prymnesium_polylepis.1
MVRSEIRVVFTHKRSVTGVSAAACPSCEVKALRASRVTRRAPPTQPDATPLVQCQLRLCGSLDFVQATRTATWALSE